MNSDKQPCVKCGLETKERLFNLEESVPFCEWCYQAFLGKARGERYERYRRREIHWEPLTGGGNNHAD
jgi:hypothetical protein